MVSWWNQSQNPTPPGMWNSMDYPNSQTSYTPHYSGPSGAETTTNWNGYYQAAQQTQHAVAIHNQQTYNNYSHEDEHVNISGVLSDRMVAEQQLSSNPYDQTAKTFMDDCDVKIKRWNDSKKQVGKVNYIKWGTTATDKQQENGNSYTNNSVKPVNKWNDTNKKTFNRSGNNDRHLKSWHDTLKEHTNGELSNRQKKREIYGIGNQAWASENFFQSLPAVNSAFGLKMLKGMGWRHGQPIGKNKEGFVAPIPVDVRIGRQGLHTAEEKVKYNLAGGRPKPIKKTTPVQNVEGKHPVSLLAEHCMKRQLSMPKYELVFEYGNFYSKSVLMNVTIEGRTFEPSQPSPYKKHAKSEAAALALKELGFLKGVS